jgi:hypothetical protein
MSDLLNSASLVLIPSGYKEDTVYSVVPSDGSGDLSFTRASNGTRVNSAGLVEVCPWNLLGYSEQFDNAAWDGLRSTIAANDTTAPNGTLTADRYTDATFTNSNGFIDATISTNSGASYTFSVYVKAGTSPFILIGFFDIANHGVLFNTSTNAISTFGSATSANVESVGNGWYRVSFAHIAGSSEMYPNISVRPTNSTANYNGTGSLTAFIWGAQLNIGSSAKPYFPTTDRLNVPRLTYQNGGGGCPSLLLEKQSTNLWYYSEQFDNSEWLKTECTITANSVISPDGTQNADKITDTTANNEHRFRATNALFTISTATTFSIFAKAGEYSKFGIADLSNGYIVKFDLSAGTIISTGTDWSNAKIENFGNGWYRLSATRSTNATCGYAMLNDSGDFVFTGTGTKGVYIWGAQVEVSSYVTSYIPSTSASATRVADACFKTGISSLIGQTEGTIFLDFYYNLTSVINTASARFQLSDGTTDKWILVSIPDASTQSVRFYQNNNGVDLSYNSSTNLLLGRNKVAVAYKSGQYAMYLNGVLSNSSTSSAAVPATSRMDLTGNVPNDPTVVEGEFNQIVLFPTRLTNAELASLTTI